MKKIITSLFLVLGISFGTFAVASPASAVNVFNACSGNAESSVCKSQNDNIGKTVTNVINTLLYVIGIIAVIMIVIGGLMYVLSSGEASSMKKAKDTILYAVIGLVVAILAYTIVNFVLSRF